MRKKAAACLLLAVMFAACTLLASCSVRLTGISMGYYEIQLNGEGASALRDELSELMGTMNFYWNLNSPQGDIARLNAKGETEVKYPETITLLRQALELQEQTAGAYNPCMLPLTACWNIKGNTENWTLPDSAAIQAAQEVVEATSLHMDGNTVTLVVDIPGEILNQNGNLTTPDGSETGTQKNTSNPGGNTTASPAATPDPNSITPGIDLGALAKGAAADRCLAHIKAAGVDSAFIDIGGSTVAALGEKKPGTPWMVGIPDPLSGGGFALQVKLTDACLVTAGQYQCYETFDDLRYGHIIEAYDGKPTPYMHLTTSATVVGPSAAVCGVLSSILSVRLPLVGQLLLEEHFPDYTAIWMQQDGYVYCSPALLSHVSVYGNADYTLMELPA